MKKRFPRDVAIEVSNSFALELAAFCQRIVVAGSIRRGKPTVGDIEIVYIPKFEERRDGLFATEIVNLVDERLNTLLAVGVIAKRPNVAGHFTWGDKNKLAIDCASGIPVDLFATTERNWWMTVVIRTGPKELNLRLIDNAAKRGLKLHAYGVYEDSEGNPVPVESEEEVFQLAGIPYLHPNQRL